MYKEIFGFVIIKFKLIIIKINQAYFLFVKFIIVKFISTCLKKKQRFSKY